MAATPEPMHMRFAVAIVIAHNRSPTFSFKDAVLHDEFHDCPVFRDALEVDDAAIRLNLEGNSDNVDRH